MTIAESMEALDAIQEGKMKQIAAWITEGKMHVSPKEAAPLLNHKNAYGLNVAAKEGNFPRNAYFFSGRNMRIMVSYLADVVRGGMHRDYL